VCGSDVYIDAPNFFFDKNTTTDSFTITDLCWECH